MARVEPTAEKCGAIVQIQRLAFPEFMIEIKCVAKV
jgi:hypothetical protein